MTTSPLRCCVSSGKLCFETHPQKAQPGGKEKSAALTAESLLGKHQIALI